MGGRPTFSLNSQQAKIMTSKASAGSLPVCIRELEPQSVCAKDCNSSGKRRREATATDSWIL